MELESKVELKDICLLMEYQSRDSVFFAPLLSQIIDENSLVTFVAITQWTPL